MLINILKHFNTRKSIQCSSSSFPYFLITDFSWCYFVAKVYHDGDRFLGGWGRLLVLCR